MMPAAVAWGDQMHAAMIDAARRDIQARFLVEGLPVDDDARIYLEIGAAAGVAAALQVLVDQGLIRMTS